MTSTESLVRFVREGLGCICPDDVFQRVEIIDGSNADGALPHQYRITIGGRLLLYVIEPGNPETLAAELAHWLRLAQRERDRRGLNRVRLVLVTDDPARVWAIAGPLTQTVLGEDEKAHLHVLRPDEVPVFDEVISGHGA